jgi:hypothetical protein
MAVLSVPAMLLLTRTAAGAAEGNAKTVLTTNYVVVTNVVIVTNYVTDSGSFSATSSVPQSVTNTFRRPPMPMQDNADWIQLKTGEWLRGKLRGYQDLKLEFDSDKMKDVTFDIKDISQIYSPRVVCLYGDKNTVVGTIHLDGSIVTVTGDGEPIVFFRDDLQGISPGAPTERNYWTGKFNLGLNIRAGNTEEIDLTSGLSLRRRTPNTDLSLNVLANYSELSGEANVNNFRGTISHEINLTRRVVVIPFYGEYYRDPFQNIAHRGTMGVGGGYYFYKQPTLEWVAFLGPAYQYTVFNTVEAGGSDTASTPALVLGTRFDKDLTQLISVDFSYQGIVTSREAGLMTHHTVATLSIDITRRLDLEFSLIWDRIEEPKASSDGTLPKKDDFRLALSIGVKF